MHYHKGFFTEKRCKEVFFFFFSPISKTNPIEYLLRKHLIKPVLEHSQTRIVINVLAISN